MIDGTYSIQVDTPLGRKDGTLTLRTDGAALSGSLTLAGQSGDFSDGTADGDAFAVSGKQKIMFMTLDYRITGRVDGDAITATADTNMGQMQMTGQRD